MILELGRIWDLFSSRSGPVVKEKNEVQNNGSLIIEHPFLFPGSVIRKEAQINVMATQRRQHLWVERIMQILHPKFPKT